MTGRGYRSPRAARRTFTGHEGSGEQNPGASRMRRRRRRRSWSRVAFDWLPFVSIVAAYRVLHRWSEPLTAKAHVEPQRGFDERLFRGTVPTVAVQRARWNPAAPRWWDYAAWLVYLSHFVVTPALAGALWVRDEEAFRRFRALVVAGAFAGFGTYVAYVATGFSNGQTTWSSGKTVNLTSSNTPLTVGVP